MSTSQHKRKNNKREMRRGCWSTDENKRFETAIWKHGRNWPAIAADVQTRNIVQVRGKADRYYNSGRWSNQERQKFMEMLEKHGRDWEAIAKAVVTRTKKQIISFASYYFLKLLKENKPLPDKVRESGTGYTEVLFLFFTVSVLQY